MHFYRLKRREFVTLLGGAAAWPLAAHAQQPAMPVVGFLGPTTPDNFASFVAAFHEGLKEAGYIEGQNVAMEYRWPEGRYDRLPMLAADLVRRQVAVIAAGGPPAARAAKAATSTVPIVFTTGDDPVEAGLVQSFNRPGGNITGVHLFLTELNAKKLGLMRDLLPQVQAMAALLNPTSKNADPQSKELQVAGRALGLHIDIFNASSESEIDGVYSNRPATARCPHRRQRSILFHSARTTGCTGRTLCYPGCLLFARVRRSGRTHDLRHQP
jgi:putative ABC transport system substrate-binding protein